MPLPAPPPRRWVRWLRLVPALLLGLVIYREKPWAHDWPALSPVAIAGMIAINFAVFLPMRTLRWRAAFTDPPPFRALYASLLEGLLANIALGFGSGDVVRAARLRSASFSANYGATMAERGAELVAIACLLLIGALAGLGWPALAGAGVLLAVYALALAFGRRLLPTLARWPRLAHGLAAGLSASRPGRVAAMTAFSLAGWLSELGIIMIGLAAFGLPHTPGTALLALLGIQVAIVVPGPPANLGTFEAGVVGGLGLAGIAVDRALGFALAYHLVMTAPVAVAGAVVFLVRGRR